jgi:uncharacterized protein
MRQQALSWLHAMKKLPLLLLLLPALVFGQSDFEETKALAEQGDASAQYNLGVMYEYGKGVPEDDAEAVKWFRLAAEQGDATAQTALGFRYEVGFGGVIQNYAEAIKWYRLAAKQGYANGQAVLGTMYYNGKGVPQNYTLAYTLYSLSVAQGEDNSVPSRDLTADMLTPEQLATGQELATKCFESGFKDCPF